MKGVSDMARYIDADNFRKTMTKRFGCIPCLTDYSEASRNDIPIDDALSLAPTADVVPKSEFVAMMQWVELLKGQLAEAKSEVDKLHEVINKFEEQSAKELRDFLCLSEKYEKSKTEYARDIFKEIENKIRTDISYIEENINQITDPDAIDGQYETIDTLEWVLSSIVELKKKHTEVAE